MNLLEMMQNEIKSHNLTNKQDIKNYIYIRTGQIFDYDPVYLISTQEEKEAFKSKRIDIKNVTDFKITCFSWAHLFADLLNVFDIPTVVAIENNHAYVKTYIGGGLLVLMI